MQNQAMQRKLKARQCVDIAACRKTADGDYVLDKFHENKDYCDASKEQWVWSIGRMLKELPRAMADGTAPVLPVGTYIASLSDRYYSMGESTTIECVWLR